MMQMLSQMQTQSSPSPSASPTASPSPSSSPDVFAQAKTQWPVLNNPNIYYKYTPRSGENVPYLEAYPPGEGGAPDSPRPSQFPMDKYGIEVYKQTTRPIDVLGDVVSHFLRNTDPTVKKYYSDFERSLTPDQTARLHQQYQYETQRGEKRPYDEWYQQSGLPAYFRGYAFQQWPDAHKYYTQDQIQMFNQMMQYLQQTPKGGQ